MIPLRTPGGAAQRTGKTEQQQRAVAPASRARIARCHDRSSPAVLQLRHGGDRRFYRVWQSVYR
jgi:hypothetical protein